MTTATELTLDQSVVSAILDIELATDTARILRGALVQQILLLTGDDLINNVADIQYDLQRFLDLVDCKDGATYAYSTDAVIDFIDELVRAEGVHVLQAIADVRLLEGAFMGLLMTFPEE